jgi:predicted metal-dependent HD superfamily phosphohydrolase
MNKNQTKIVAEAKGYASAILKKQVPPTFRFHNVAHTKDVAKSTGLIEGHYQLSDIDRFIIFIAAWFHDTGFSAGCAEGHEEESVRLAAQFLQQHNVDADIINQVSSCIHATRIPQTPVTMLEKIICDADLYHLGTSKFQKWSDRLRQELLNSNKSDPTDEEWRQADIDLLTSHCYYTSYCQQKLEHVKQEWIEVLQDKQSAATCKDVKCSVL